MSIEKIINDAWENKDQVNKDSDKSIIDAIKETINLLNEGKITVAEQQGNDEEAENDHEEVICRGYGTCTH